MNRFIATTLLCLTSGVAFAGPMTHHLPSEDCFEQIENGTAADITCIVPLRMNETERAELAAATREYVTDIDCTLTVKIARQLLDDAIVKSDYAFKSPEQPVVCSISTHKSKFDVTATFAPRIVIAGDKAVEASPGLANVKGITGILSWPAVQFINRWPSVKAGMLQVVNAYRKHARDKRQAGAK